MKSRFIKPTTALLVAAWALTAAGGMAGMMAYGRRPDAAADALRAWPTLASVARPTQPTLLVCLHPKCPCSDATIDAVEKLLLTSPRLSAVALMAIPAGRTDWQSAALVERCRSIKGLRVVIDTDGLDCAALDARSSGQSFLYDADGRLMFAGGLTDGRGERGDAVGQTYVADILAGRQDRARVLLSPVFGCVLYRKPVVEVSR